MHTYLFVALALLLTAGCAPQQAALTPAPSAQEEPGATKAATAEVAGVRVTVAPDQWTGPPATIPEVRALHAAIDNRSGRPLRLRYNEFRLMSPAGTTATALPPHQIERTAVTAIPQPAFHSHRFWVAPHHTHFYPHMTPWPHRFAFDEAYYTRHYGLWHEYYPTQEIVEQAIPEGVLDDGGQVAGFVYFQEIDPELTRITFTMELVDAQTEESFGTVQLPFLVEGQG